jgi:hypothetical protein
VEPGIAKLLELVLPANHVDQPYPSCCTVLHLGNSEAQVGMGTPVSGEDRGVSGTDTCQVHIANLSVCGLRSPRTDRVLKRYRSLEKY